MHPTQNLLKAVANAMRRGTGLKVADRAAAARRSLKSTNLHGEAEGPIKTAGLANVGDMRSPDAVQNVYMAPVPRALRTFMDSRNHEDIPSALKSTPLADYLVMQSADFAFFDLDTGFKQLNATTIHRSIGIQVLGPKAYRVIHAVTKVPTLDAELANPENKKEHDERLCAGGNHSGPNYQVTETYHTDPVEIYAFLCPTLTALDPEILSRAKRGANWRNKATPSYELQLNNLLIKAGVSQKCLVHMMNGRYQGKGYPAGLIYEFLRQASIYTAKANLWEKEAFAKGVIKQMTPPDDRRTQVVYSLLSDFFQVKISDIGHLTKIEGVENKARRRRPFPRPKIETEKLPIVN